MEQGHPLSPDDLAPATLTSLAELRAAVDADQKLGPYARQAAGMHRKNARAWASAAAGTDLTAQIDPGFVISPAAALVSTQTA